MKAYACFLLLSFAVFFDLVGCQEEGESLFGMLGDRIRGRIRQRIVDRLEGRGNHSTVIDAFHGRIHDRIHDKVQNFRNNLTNIAKECFKNEHGYKCCSVELFTFLGSALKKHPLLVRLISRMDLKRLVEKILELVQLHFKTSFEVIVAPSDFASKNTFRGDLMCKTKTPSGKVVLVYATPVPYSIEPGIFRRLTSHEVQAQKFPDSFRRISEIALFAGKH